MDYNRIPSHKSRLKKSVVVRQTCQLHSLLVWCQLIAILFDAGNLKRNIELVVDNRELIFSEKITLDWDE